MKISAGYAILPQNGYGEIRRIFFSFALSLSSYREILLKTCLTPTVSFTSLMELCHILYIAYGIYCMQLFHIAVMQPMEQF